MDKFWKWMKEKNYADFGGVEYPRYFLYDNLRDHCEPTKQMLMGYMMEYFLANNIDFESIINYNRE